VVVLYVDYTQHDAGCDGRLTGSKILLVQESTGLDMIVKDFVFMGASSVTNHHDKSGTQSGRSWCYHDKGHQGATMNQEAVSVF
jgi:hypothetical protein